MDSPVSSTLSGSAGIGVGSGVGVSLPMARIVPNTFHFAEAL